MKIAVLGGGIEGSSLIRYFSKRGEEITLCDKKKLNLTSFSAKPHHIKFGPLYAENLEKFDMVFRSPGIPFLTPAIQHAIQQGTLVTSLTKYFFEKCPAKIIAVTGTKGKGTTATLLYEILKEHFSYKIDLPSSRIFLGGNIGKSPLDFLDELKPSDWVILELSSFQLQDLTQSPHVAVVLPITEDHLDHHKSMEEYIEAKRNMVRYQNEDDIVIINVDADKNYPNFAASFFASIKTKNIWNVSLHETKSRGPRASATKGRMVSPRIIKNLKSPLRGSHNQENILAASYAALALGVPEKIIRTAVENFHGLPHRLEFVTEINGVKFFDDSASTNPDTTIAALRSFENPVILIAGGSEKFVQYERLGEEIVGRPHVKTVVLMGETSKSIEKAIDRVSQHRKMPLELIMADNYQEAFMAAKVLAKPGDTVLLSPASASFDMFRNYQERGEIFKAFVKNLADF